MQKHGLNVFTILLWGQSIQTALPPKRHFEEPTSAVDPGQLDECCSQSKFVSFCLLIWKTDTYVFVFGILGLSCKLFPYVSIFFRVCLIPRTLPGWKLMQTFILKPATPVQRWVLQVRGWGSARTFCKASLQTWNLLLGMCWVWWLFLLLMFLLDKKWDKNIDIACIYWFRPSEIYSYIYMYIHIYVCIYVGFKRGPFQGLEEACKRWEKTSSFATTSGAWGLPNICFQTKNHNIYMFRGKSYYSWTLFRCWKFWSKSDAPSLARRFLMNLKVKRFQNPKRSAKRRKRHHEGL